ncbi:MAG: XrtA system polysaccharide deacetylase [Pseudomonadota bacterium]
MKNAMSIDVEDWFQVENLRPVYPRDTWDAQALRVQIGTDKALEILDEANARATFFVLGWVAERCPEVVRAIVAAGHELASHGYNHDLVYELGPERFREDVRRSKSLLEDIGGVEILGYRAPNFSITSESLWAPEILLELGFSYDSSVYPTSMHDRYGLDDYGDKPFDWPCGLREVPLAVATIGKSNLPVSGGGYFRLFPYSLTRAALKGINRKDTNFTFYLHPWELDPGQPREKRVRLSHRFRHYVNLKSTADKLRRLVNDFEFDTIRAAYSL